MSASTRESFSSLIARLISHIRTPLFWNGYALIINTGITSGLGMLAWVMAARNYTTDVVGLNSAMLSSMMFLSSLAQLHLSNALNRFIPAAGRATGRLIAYTFLLCTVLALAASLIFIAGLGLWAPSIGMLRSDPWLAVWFTFSTIAWCLFVLQEGALVGLRQAIWTPIKNSLFSLAKLILVVLCATLLPQYGVFVSWTAPVGLFVLAVTLLIFLQLVPRQVRGAETQAASVSPRQIAKYVAGDYFASTISMATVDLLPVFVLEWGQASSTAYYYLSWQIAYMLYLIPRNMGSSLIAETATDESRLGVYTHQAFIQAARLVILGAAAIIIGAPYILRLFGDNYSAEGVTLLRLLCLSSIPGIVTTIYASVARAQCRMKALVWMMAAQCVLVFGFSYLLMKIYGVTGVGLAWLLSQCIIATVLMLTELRALWLPYLNTRLLTRLLALASDIVWRLRSRHTVMHADEVVSAVLPSLSSLVDIPWNDDGIVQRVVPTDSDTTVILLGQKNQPPVALLKLPQNETALKSLKREQAVLSSLHSDSRLGDWRNLLPTFVADGFIGDQPYQIELARPGIDARHVVADPATRIQMQAAALAAIHELHSRTLSPVIVTNTQLADWIDTPLGVLQEVVARRPTAICNEHTFERLGAELRGSLSGCTLPVGWIHGDFFPGNILVTPDGKTVTGIVDWELARPASLPYLDVMWLMVTTRLQVEGGELGDLVRKLIAGNSWSSQEDDLLEDALRALPGKPPDRRTMLLLCWLHHMTATATNMPRYASHWWWVSKNIEGVLCYI